MTARPELLAFLRALRTLTEADPDLAEYILACRKLDERDFVAGRHGPGRPFNEPIGLSDADLETIADEWIANSERECAEVDAMEVTHMADLAAEDAARAMEVN